MYRPIVKLNTNVCKVCNRVFKSEKALKDHIFSSRVNDKDHVLFKKELRNKRFENARLQCPICKQKIFRNMRTHFKSNKDKTHDNFLKKQIEFFVKKYLDGNSCSDILNIKNRYTNNFSYKYVAFFIINSIGKPRFDEISKIIFSKKRRDYWKNFSVKKRKEIMKRVYESEWKNLTPEQRKNHPWVIAGRKASLESSKKGSKNQEYAYTLLLKELSDFEWKYNYTIKKDWHIDIASPKKKIFIEWDGRHHRIPIHGNSYLSNRRNRDKIKNKIITDEIKGILIRVRDDGRENLSFVKKKVKEIKGLVNNKINKSKIIRI